MADDKNAVTGASLQCQRKEGRQKRKSLETLIKSGFFGMLRHETEAAAEKSKKLLFCNKFVIIFLRFAHKKIGKGRKKVLENAI